MKKKIAYGQEDFVINTAIIVISITALLAFVFLTIN